MRERKQMYKVSKKAERDLIDIWQYTLEHWSREQANKYLKTILGTFEQIDKNPFATGKSCDHIRIGYRKLKVGKHMVFYKILNTNTVLISRILHEKMDFERHI